MMSCVLRRGWGWGLSESDASCSQSRVLHHTVCNARLAQQCPPPAPGEKSFFGQDWSSLSPLLPIQRAGRLCKGSVHINEIKTPPALRTCCDNLREEATWARASNWPSGHLRRAGAGRPGLASRPFQPLTAPAGSSRPRPSGRSLPLRSPSPSPPAAVEDGAERAGW